MIVLDADARWCFTFGDEVRVLRDPDGPPTGRQLLKLAHLGLLEIRDEPGPPITKLAAAQALDQAEAE